MRWRCIRTGPQSESWTVGKVYKTTKEGQLIDDSGEIRLRPESYNKIQDRPWTNFKPFAENLENK